MTNEYADYIREWNFKVLAQLHYKSKDKSQLVPAVMVSLFCISISGAVLYSSSVNEIECFIYCIILKVHCFLAFDMALR